MRILPILEKLSPDLRTCLKNVSVKTFPFVMLELFLNLQHVFPIYSRTKVECLIACALTLFTHFRVVYAMLTITAKHAGI